MPNGKELTNNTQQNWMKKKNDKKHKPMNRKSNHEKEIAQCEQPYMPKLFCVINFDELFQWCV